MFQSALGLGLTIGWLWLTFLNGPIMHYLASHSAFTAASLLLIFLFLHAVSFLLVSYRSNYIIAHHNQFNLISGLFMSLSVIAAQFIYGQFFSKLMTIAILLLAAVGASTLMSAWGYRYSQMPTRQTGLAFAGAIIISTIISIFGLSIPPTGLILIVLAAPVLSLLLLRIKPSNDKEEHCQPPTTRTTTNPLPFKLVALLFLFYAAGGFTYKLIYSTSPIIDQHLYQISSIVYCIVCTLAGGAIFFFPNVDLRLLYRPVLPLLGSGFILFPVMVKTSLWPYILLQSGFALLDTYTWLLFAHLASNHFNPLYVIGWSLFFLTFPIFVGDALLTAMLNLTISFQPNMFAVFAAIIVLTASLIFHDKTETFSGWTTTDTDETNSVRPNNQTNDCDKQHDLIAGVAFDAFCNLYSLTSREIEITQLLLKGRNNPFIRDELNIADSTLKTHLRNIYRKTNVSDRQNLMSSFDSHLQNLSSKTNS